MNLDDLQSGPNVLYKYRTLSGEGSTWVRQTIVENEIYFSSPSRFNDPFDCKVFMSFGGSSRTWKKHFMALLKKNRPDLNRQQRQAEAHRIANDEKAHRNPEALGRMIADVQRRVDDIGIFSLCARNDDILMWSYYAQNHEGLCLGFFRSGMFSGALPVEYSHTFPRVDYLKDTPERQMEAHCLTKAAAWQHEKEWRLFDIECGPGCRQYPPELLGEIILGSRMSQERRDDILSWAQHHQPTPKLFEALLSDDAYGIKLREL
ncbi:MAG: DUF2971 domain-containing protein [Thermoanaerobaculia bacterium]|nr:DUF2971 domain-containing protein [Thermoanaerobaculia bacterium]